MFIVKIHRTMVGETREFVNDMYGPFADWGTASKYADAYCNLWRDERATASIECLYEPSEIILARAEREASNAREARNMAAIDATCAECDALETEIPF